MKIKVIHENRDPKDGEIRPCFHILVLVEDSNEHDNITIYCKDCNKTYNIWIDPND